MSDTLTPYYEDEFVRLYHGDCRGILPLLEDRFDLAVTDPPYGETSLTWDKWPDDWPKALADYGVTSLWCFGSMRMFLDRRDEFDGWQLSQDVVWEKHNGSGFAADRFKRVHEHATHWYRGQWGEVYAATPTTNDAVRRVTRRKTRPTHTGNIEARAYTSEDGGPRLMRSVIYCTSMHGQALHPTEKPTGILEPLIAYGCPSGGFVLDPFAGSGSTGAAAKATGRRAVLIEADERYCEIAARRLYQDVLPFETEGEG